MDWHTPIRFLPHVGPIVAKKLEKLEIETVGDLLWHLPFRYADYSLISKIGQLQAGETVTVIGKVTDIKNVYTKRGFVLQKARVADETGELEITWFNQPFLVTTLKNTDKVAFVGKVEMDRFILTFVSPDYEIIRQQPLLHAGRFVPIYPETAGITSRWLRTRIFSLLSADWLSEYLPQSILDRYDFPDFVQALKQVHFPKTLTQADAARRRLAFDELFLLQLTALMRRREWQTQTQTHPFTIDATKLIEFMQKLPFILTAAQKRAVKAILADLSQTHPMNRLLEGDVGSGKTVVAAIAMYAARLNGFQSLLMAPTEILAEQHYQTLANLLTPFGIKIGIQTGSKKNSPQPSLVKRGSNFPPLNKRGSGGIHRELDVLVGTHALIEKKVQLESVKLVVIDEQHRFGVAQRALLRQKGHTPHVLTMTATPIPRTQMLTFYGDLDLSVIDEMPPGRRRTKTWVVPPEKREAAYNWIRKQVQSFVNPENSAQQNQTFIICPFIEPSETLTSVKAATEEFKHLQTEVFPDLRLSLLHGKMKAAEKQQILNDFRLGKFAILVTTPVVEVGIDIRAASIILIEGAERFGLAQLHQLRGRVGRSGQQGYCLLFLSNFSAESLNRLKHLEKNLSGGELAELDLKIRGPGQIYGTAQHGRETLKIARFTDTGLLQNARMEAEKLLKFDPQLTSFSALKHRLKSSTILNGPVTPD